MLRFILYPMMLTEISLQEQYEHGEGPIWDERKQRLYWVDILKGNIHYGDRQSNFSHIHTISVGEPVGVVGLCHAENTLIAGLKSSFALINIDTGTVSKLVELDQEIADTRFNDGKVGPDSRFYAGTMGNGDDAVGNFYHLSGNKTIQLLERQLQVSNGLDWSLDGKTFYLTDSPTQLIFAYDFDAEAGIISNKRIHVDSSDDVGVPDGMCIDEEGCLWSARWEGAKVVRYDPDGKKMMEMPLPALCPTSCCFGGENMDELFVTSSKIILTEKQLLQYPQSGQIFRIKTDTKGFVSNRFVN